MRCCEQPKQTFHLTYTVRTKSMSEYVLYTTAETFRFIQSVIFFAEFESQNFIAYS